jgi:hypothetical protein
MATQLKPTIECSKEEWQARLDLAACYRIFDHLGWSESIYNHISLKVPGEKDTFLINPFGLLYSEVTASNLVKIDVEGNNVGGSPYMVNKAGFTQHAYLRWRVIGTGCCQPISTPATSSARSAITTSRA